MKQLHLISGMPRSGSTLLCQILSMHKDHYATPTSPMLDMLISQQAVFSHNGGFKAVDRLEFYNDFAEAQKSFLETYYKQQKIVFDKNRGWPMHLMKLDEIMANEDTKIIWTYRDPLEIIASMESQHRKFPLIQYTEEQQSPGGLSSLDARIGHFVSDNSIMVLPARALHEAVHTGYSDRIKIIDYKSLCKFPQETLDEIHEFLGLEPHKYDAKDWKDLKQVTHEHDHLYNYKYPHQIQEGEIKYVKHDTKYLEGNYAKLVDERFKWLKEHCEKEVTKVSNPRSPRIGRVNKPGTARSNHRQLVEK